MYKLDSHQHFWRLQRGDYAWLSPDLKTLYRDFLPEDYLRASKPAHVSSTILVQAADTEAETEFLLQLAEQNDFIAGVVGWVEFASPNAVQKLSEFAKNAWFKGVRPMLQDIEEERWILNPEFAPVFRFLSDNNLTFDALVTIQQLPAIEQIACAYPNLKIVIDHCGKPEIAGGHYSLWAAQMCKFKKYTNVFVKFSGLTTEALPTQNSAKDYENYFKLIYKVFGHGRVMWGSDWPVIYLKSEMQSWIEICEQLTSRFNAYEKLLFWQQTARSFYRIPNNTGDFI